MSCRLPVLALLATLALAPAAEAATVGIQDSARKLRFDAAAGEANRVTVTRSGDTVTFEDAGAPVEVKPNATGCTADGPSRVSCVVPSPEFRVQVDAVDGDDEVVSQAAIAVKLEGGEGNDRLTGGPGADELSGSAGDDVLLARDAVRDSVACGDGADSGEADLEDDVLGDCEAVVKPLVPPTLEPAPEPVPGKAVAVGVTTGTARIRLPGAAGFVPVSAATTIPVGSTVDARQGKVTLRAASDLVGGVQTAAFTGGVFSVSQSRAARMTTVLTLRGGDFSRCRPRARTAAFAAADKPVRRLWGSGHGRFHTRGRTSVAAVRGTIWSVADRCDGTLTRVQRGIVAVRDLRLRRTRLVRAGGSYLARARR